ncbi:hypothetical protein CBOM_04636 [Ceraceosorus bombacis]|uniref:Uncharacterized protein n=1 Tax=Ceraceosorus bombacis TaxID=401625 RepID=A0A0P1BMY5_9BASI|nr:hypothetical protein CBOM_04636 [Ceraceosorus bombacis]
MSHPLSSATMTSPLMMQIGEGEDLINPSKSAAHQSERIHLHGRHPHHLHRQDVATRPPRGPANPGGGDDIANMMVSAQMTER